MGFPRELVKAAFAALPLKTLRELAKFEEVRGYQAMTADNLLRKLNPDKYYLSGQIRSLSPADLVRVAGAVGYLPRPAKEMELRKGLYLYVSDYDEIRNREKSKKRAGLLPAMTVEVLNLNAEKIARPVAHLSPKGKQPPVALWSAEHDQKSRGERLWISIDLRHHPDPSLRRSGVLEVTVDDRKGNGRAEFRAGVLKPPQGKEVSLFGAAAQDWPTLDVLLRKGGASIQNWLKELKKLGWKMYDFAADSTFPHHEVLEKYRKAWRGKHPLYKKGAYAQFGGWPVSWYEEGVDEQLGRKLVLRTYRAAEPWVEVFQDGRGYDVRLRIT